MVVTLLAALGIQAFSGLFGNDEIFNRWPAVWICQQGSEPAADFLARNTVLLDHAAAAIHILAVIAHYVFERRNLLHAMITGHKPPDSVAETEAIASSRTWLAVLVDPCPRWSACLGC